MKIMSVLSCCKEHVKAIKEDFIVERVVGTELTPSLKFNEEQYLKVDTIYYNDLELQIWNLERYGLTLYAKHSENRISREYLLYINSQQPKSLECPPTISDLIEECFKQKNVLLACFLLYHISNAAARPAWGVWAVWGVARDAWDAAWNAARVAARDTRVAVRAAWGTAWAIQDIWNAATCWDVIVAVQGAKKARSLYWKAIKLLLRGYNQ